jgi:hypothetical protein
MAPVAMLLVLLESPQWVHMNWGGLVMFRPTLLELLNIEQFCERKFKKFNTNYLKEAKASSWYDWKACDKWGFLEVMCNFKT